MRGNGLEAASYVAIAELDPRVADVLLDLLRDAGVAAYAVPCQPVAGILLEVRAPIEPRDRLHVDEAGLDQARELVRKHLAEAREGGALDDDLDGDASDLDGVASDVADDDPDSDASAAGTKANSQDSADEAFAKIVEGYESSSDLPVAPWPTAEDADENDDRPGRDEDEDAQVRTPGSDDKAEQSEEGYVPPPPPPLPRLDGITKASWAALIGGPVLLLATTFAGAYVPDWFAPLGIAAFLGGFIVLVLRMRGGPPDQTDDGAVV